MGRWRCWVPGLAQQDQVILHGVSLSPSALRVHGFTWVGPVIAAGESQLVFLPCSPVCGGHGCECILPAQMLVGMGFRALQVTFEGEILA